MYNLAAYPEYVEPLREEIAAELTTTGKMTVSNLRKLDSFLEESIRLHPLSAGMSLRNPVRKISQLYWESDEAVHLFEWNHSCSRYNNR